MYESEVVTIKTISAKTITFEPALKHKHISEVEQYAGLGVANQDVNWDVPMRAEVGCLTRNIVI